VILSNDGDQYHRFLLSAELNAAWNGNESNPAAVPAGQFGIGIYNTGMQSGKTVNYILHLAYTNGSVDLSDLEYLGSNGEGASASSCRVK
jgi:hypothetical protein